MLGFREHLTSPFNEASDRGRLESHRKNIIFVMYAKNSFQTQSNILQFAEKGKLKDKQM